MNELPEFWYYIYICIITIFKWLLMFDTHILELSLIGGWGINPKF